MVAKLILKVGDHSITQDELGQYHLLDAQAKTVGVGPSLEAMTNLGRLMTIAPGLTVDGLCACQAYKDGRLIARLSDALATTKLEIDKGWKKYDESRQEVARLRGEQEKMEAMAADCDCHKDACASVRAKAHLAIREMQRIKLQTMHQAVQEWNKWDRSRSNDFGDHLIKLGGQA